MKKFFFQIPFEQKNIEVKDDGTLVISGMASTKDLDRYDDVVEPTAFKETLPTFMKNPVMLLQHNANKPIGKFTESKITDDGLEVKGSVSYDEDGCIQKIKDGILGAFSIGYKPKKYEVRNAEDELIATENGYEKGFNWEDLYEKGVVRTIKELDLVEISVVSTPANPNAVFGLEKSVKGFFDEEMKSWKQEIEEKSQESQEEKETSSASEVETPEEEEICETDDLANEVIQKEEEHAEMPADSEDPVDETSDNSETPVETEEKSLTEEKTEIKALKEDVEKSKQGMKTLLKAYESLKSDFAELKEVVGKIPARQ